MTTDTPQHSATTTSALSSVSTGQPDESVKWRTFIVPASDPHLAQLWDCYSTDAHMRAQSPKPYAEFLQVARHLTHPELPEFWNLYLHTALQSEKIPESFLTFAERMQRQLTTQASANPPR